MSDLLKKEIENALIRLSLFLDHNDHMNDHMIETMTTYLELTREYANEGDILSAYNQAVGYQEFLRGLYYGDRIDLETLYNLSVPVIMVEDEIEKELRTKLNNLKEQKNNRSYVTRTKGEEIMNNSRRKRD